MAKKLAYERFLWFHARLKQNRYPKLRDLAGQFEISLRQAAREIDFMRTFFDAPVEYCPERSGYRYTRDDFELPGLWLGDEEFLALLIAKRLAAAIPDRRLKRSIDAHFAKICLHLGIEPGDFERRVSLKNVRYGRVSPDIFATVMRGLSSGTKLRLRYHSPHTGRQSERSVAPLHLLLYMGNWHLLAYCDERRGMRDFLLSRIEAVEASGQRVPPDLAALDLHSQIEEQYGIFLSGPAFEIRLRFSPEAAPTVMEQVWFPGQSAVRRPDGSLDLSFPASDLREVLRDILPYGGEVEVIAPAELRERAAAAARGLARRYEIIP